MITVDSDTPVCALARAHTRLIKPRGMRGAHQRASVLLSRTVDVRMRGIVVLARRNRAVQTTVLLKSLTALSHSPSLLVDNARELVCARSCAAISTASAHASERFSKRNARRETIYLVSCGAREARGWNFKCNATYHRDTYASNLHGSSAS